MKVLIIEDENRAAQRLEKLILEIDSDIEVLAIFDSVEDSITWFKNNEAPQLIFLDIHLSDGLSFNIFNSVQVNCPIIFTTAYDEYALRAFDLNSIDYLLKPIDKTKLQRAIDKYKKFASPHINQEVNTDILSLLNSMESKKPFYRSSFLINKNDSFHIINITQISYFYSEDKLTFIKTNEDKRYIIDESLDNLMDSLDPTKFFRINRQVIISINSIKSINNYFNYKLKLELFPHTEGLNTVISRSKVSEFKEWVKFN
ncbi:MAG: LytTR family DNA-binding domain-containing protein [Saprospiraceae bacterium]